MPEPSTIRHKRPATAAIPLRILLFANLIATIAYGAVTPSQMYKVTAECITIGIAGLAMIVQVVASLARWRCLPYNIWAMISLDGLCIAGWCTAIAVMAYWDLKIVYLPRDGDPLAWFKCAESEYWSKVLTPDGIGLWINLRWCEVVVKGQNRLVGNGAARRQLHALIGLSSVSLLFTVCLIALAIRRGKFLGLIRDR